MKFVGLGWTRNKRVARRQRSEYRRENNENQRSAIEKLDKAKVSKRVRSENKRTATGSSEKPARTNREPRTNKRWPMKANGTTTNTNKEPTNANEKQTRFSKSKLKLKWGKPCNVSWNRNEVCFWTSSIIVNPVKTKKKGHDISPGAARRFIFPGQSQGDAKHQTITADTSPR